MEAQAQDLRDPDNVAQCCATACHRSFQSLLLLVTNFMTNSYLEMCAVEPTQLTIVLNSTLFGASHFAATCRNANTTAVPVVLQCRIVRVCVCVHLRACVSEYTRVCACARVCTCGCASHSLRTRVCTRKPTLPAAAPACGSAVCQSVRGLPIMSAAVAPARGCGMSTPQEF